MPVKPPDNPPPDDPNPPQAPGPGLRRLLTVATPYGPGPIACSSDSRILLALYADKVLRVDTETGKEREPAQRLPGNTISMVLSGNGKTLVTGSGLERPLRLWNPDTGEPIRSLEGQTATAARLAVSFDGQTVASVADSTLRIWDADTGKVRLALDQSARETENLALSPDGKRVAFIRKGKGEIELVDTLTGQMREKLASLEHSPVYLAFSPDGKALALGDQLGHVQLWDVETRQQRWALAFKVSLQQSLVFSPDGRYLAAAEADAVRLIDWQKGQVSHLLPAPRSNFFFLVFSPDGKTLAGSNHGPTLYSWDLTALKP
jgi:WD40 repeat protein